MRDLVYLVRLRAYARRYGLIGMPISLVERCYLLDKS
jgi:hypothetical protein